MSDELTPREKLLEIFAAGVTYIPDDWLGKMCWEQVRGRYRAPVKYYLCPVACTIARLSWANGGGAINLPKKLLDKEPIARIGTLHLLLELSDAASIPYDGLGARLIWRRTLLALERADVLRLTWRKEAVLVAPILSKKQRQFLRKHWRAVLDEQTR
jgi:hypothetical protein